ncbi:hypothetical protein SAY87_016086 [Trapa incisa]|uniref:protein-disulfide reductase n=1 Tax=Trapa incisa TaxID=236973 RepID=A0AAN7LEP5_9MYRT|nr:hypothetical protein SAY87_016086 [Trapa incisa]
MAEENIAEIMDGQTYDITSLLSSPGRDFLLRNNGDQVKIDTLKSKKLGLYFSASWCGPCQRFTPVLVEAYEDLGGKGDFEVVFISSDRDYEAFNKYFSKMPWLAVPFTDPEKQKSLKTLFKVRGIPHLVIIDETGRVSSDEGVEIVREYGIEAYPFTVERIQELKDMEEDARMNQTLETILVRGSRDFVLSSDGGKVPVSKLQGKIVGIYFSHSSYGSCADFNPKLLEMHEKLKAKGENFEIVMVPLDDDQESFNQSFEAMPWLSLPVKDKTCEKLARYFELETLPTLVIVGTDGKTLHPNAAEAVEEHGTAAYPFTPEKFAELAEIEKAKAETQTLESVLVSGDLDYVIGKGGAEVPVADLVGKTILLYFSAHWCPPCRAFLPKLVQAYNKIKSKGEAFEVIFISSDRDQASFDDFFSGMPWLALPFGDPRKSSLSRKFKVQGIPMVVALGPTGRTVTTEARGQIMQHGHDAYPFTEEHVKKLQAKLEEMVKGWAKKLKHESHEHELVLSKRMNYGCDACNEMGQGWSYYCNDCDFDLHPKCAFAEEDKEAEGAAKEGWVCEGDVCHKA